jgi:hypothetical protein
MPGYFTEDNLRRQRRSKPASVLIFALLTLAHSGRLFALTADKAIEVERQHRDEPVLINKVTVGATDVQCGMVTSVGDFQPIVPFVAGEDWLSRTSISLLNRTDKAIAFGQVSLVFPETGDGSLQKPLAAYTITFGRIPAVVAFSGKGRPLTQPSDLSPISFAPGQTLTINVGDYIDLIKGSVVSMPFAALTKVKIQRSVFIFEDGMKWDGGYSVADAEHPGKWKPVEGRYFPGHPSWPPK